MVDDREGELQPMPDERVAHRKPRWQGNRIRKARRSAKFREMAEFVGERRIVPCLRPGSQNVSQEAR